MICQLRAIFSRFWWNYASCRLYFKSTGSAMTQSPQSRWSYGCCWRTQQWQLSSFGDWNTSAWPGPLTVYSRTNPAPSLINAQIRWDIIEELQRNQASEPTPPNCPTNKYYMPTELRQRIINWIHTSWCSGHLRIQHTKKLIQNTFSWLTLPADVKQYVEKCTVFVQVRTSRQLDI